MYGEIFVFGTKIFHEEPKRDALTILPLELTWKIFSYLDDASLQVAFKTHKVWARIISANKKLQRRLEKFDLIVKLGSAKLAKFVRRNKRKLKKERKRLNYVPLGESEVRKIKQEDEKSSQLQHSDSDKKKERTEPYNMFVDGSDSSAVGDNVNNTTIDLETLQYLKDEDNTLKFLNRYKHVKKTLP